MMLQQLIVIAIIVAAVVYVGMIMLRKSRSFSRKHGCGNDCGCNGREKNITS